MGEMAPKRAMTAASWGTDSVSSVQGFLARLWAAFLTSLVEFVAMRFFIAAMLNAAGTGDTAATATAAEVLDLAVGAGLALALALASVHVRAFLSSRSRSERSAARF